MKSFFRFALLALMLLVVALLSALTAMRLAIHGREVAVPDLVGKTPVEARKIAEQIGLQMHVEPQSFVMPNFVGQPLGSVTLALQDAGFRLGAVTVQSGTAAGSSARSPASIIVSQNPVAGAKVMAGSAITFVVQ